MRHLLLHCKKPLLNCSRRRCCAGCAGKVATMYDLTTALRLTNAWNEAVFRSLLSAAATFAALTQETVNSWNGARANSRASGVMVRATGRVPELDVFEAWPRLFGAESWTSPFSAFRFTPSYSFGHPWFSTHSAWRAFRPADWVSLLSLTAL